ncbi:MAG: alpha/beta hydrolase [Opitutae bacterium]|mgnify:FL=1|jgi:dienelactone hydrolase|nr:alpha/beta hydrolase [Opitutae bacterium]
MKVTKIVILLLFPSLLLGRKTEDVEVVYELKKNVSYLDENGSIDPYRKQRCKLDLYYPRSEKAFPTVVWFHGGGLRSGEKSIPKQLRKQGIAVVAPNYRLFPKAKCPDYVDDAAAAVAWTFRNIGKFGGDPGLIFVSGHSAGGYLTSMIGLDKAYLAEHGIDADRLAGLIPFSGHTITHFTPREERGISKKQVVVDKFAPIFHLRKEAATILIITGDRKLEMLGRHEENAYFWRMLKVVGHPNAEILELSGFDHGGMASPAFPHLLKFVKKQKNR